MTLKARLSRLAKAVPKPEPGMGHAPEWFANKVIALCRHIYEHAGLDPNATRLHPPEKSLISVSAGERVEGAGDCQMLGVFG
jgi:hypothetical protein